MHRNSHYFRIFCLINLLNSTDKPKFHCWKKHKVAVHSVDYELKCTILANPRLRKAHFEFMWNDQKVVLEEGNKTEDGEIQFLPLKVSVIQPSLS